ncbi:hypothetical protein NA57DRAFT_69631 [Rhizodiscina lignyota]|uniref:WSC domain-containing protein n=1 Tax=Rhizodiscina lignyota TaxID=1504668 RepID=A0A9P4I5A2_9PEZI|nr:hypothetical protein NA57DRAFT_69631 [Rhizodiscina lignyota]
MRTTALVTILLVTSIAHTDAYVSFNCASNIVEERADSIVQPLQVASHVRKIVGGNAFKMSGNMTCQEIRSSSCSSCLIKQDLSIYLTPKLYCHAQNGSFMSVLMDGNSSSDLNIGMVLLPASALLAGNTLKRNFTSDFAAQAVNLNCLESNRSETNSLPNYKCPDGQRAQLFFPSCWDGRLNRTDKSHMSYPASGSHDNGPSVQLKQDHLICHPRTNAPVVDLLKRAAAYLSIKVPSQVNETVCGVLSRLPGSNPIQDGAWQELRTLNGSHTTGTGNGMTVEYYLNFCTGSTYAGIECGSECYCGNLLPSSAAPKAGMPGGCNMPCNGNSTEFCGDNWALSTYQKCSGGSYMNNPPSISQVKRDMPDPETQHWFGRRFLQYP